jgi:catechol 2,3-dioxygenase-like lactoylglutathione lyase family enzyme
VPELFAGLPVADHALASAWYERLLGEPPFMRPHERESVWRLEEHAWVYVVEDPDRAGNGLLTVLVDDLDAQIAELAGRGVTTDPIESIPGKVRTAEIRDPDGNRIKFGQPMTQPEEEAES